MRTKSQRVLSLAAASVLASGCGLEGIFNLYGGDEYTQPVSTIRGTVALPAPTLQVLDAAGEEITPFALTVQNGQYEVQLYSGNYSGLRMRAFQGQGILEAFVPTLKNEGTVEGVNLDLQSTATVKVVEGQLGPKNTTLARLSDNLVCIMGKKVAAGSARPGALADLLGMMKRVSERANLELNTTTRVFQSPEVTVDDAGEFKVATSALNPAWVSRTSFDYDGDGAINQTTSVFDRSFVETLKANELAAPPNPALVRTVFMVDFNEGKLNGACGNIDRFRWVRPEPGRQMFFVGGIHQTSPVQDPVVDAMLGNRGGWTPNQIAMYDDGTNGDKVSGDGIWTITFDLPRGVRLGYKYTWGNKGDLWTGTEEWPGNQRILEVVDVNGDGFVTRFDNFGDEASNKDLSNLNPKAGGTLAWDEDVNKDGFAEARESPALVDQDCTPEAIITPEWVSPLTVSCDEFVAE